MRSILRLALCAVAGAAPLIAVQDSTRAASVAVATNGSVLGVRGGNLYTFNPDGTGGKKLTKTGKASAGSFSPDGRRIVYTDRSTGNGDIYVMNRDGSNKKRVTTHPATEGSPSFSSDGKKIAFDSSRHKVADNHGDEIILSDVYLLNSTAPYGAAKKITNSQVGDPYTECWGDYSSYSGPAFHPGRANQLAVHSICGYWSEPDDAFTDFITTSGQVIGGVYGGAVDWAPDGVRFAYASTDDEDSFPDNIRIHTPAGSYDLTPRPTWENDGPNFPSTGSPIWSPDSKLIAFVRRTDSPTSSGTYFIRPDGTRERIFLSNFGVTDWARK